MTDEKNYSLFPSSELPQVNNNSSSSTYTVNIPQSAMVNVGSAAASYNIKVGYADHPNLGSSWEYVSYYDIKLGEKYPALKQAWEHFKNVLAICKSKEQENNDH